MLIVCYVHCVACKGREVCLSSWFSVTQRFDGEPGRTEDRSKVAQVRLDFSIPLRSHCFRATGLCTGGLSPVESGRKGAGKIAKRFLEKVSEVVRDLVVTDGRFPSCQPPAYRL